MNEKKLQYKIILVKIKIFIYKSLINRRKISIIFIIYDNKNYAQ